MVRSKECFQQQIFFETNLQKETRFLNTCYPSIHFFDASKSKYFFPFISPSPLGIFKELKKGGALWGVPLFVFLYHIWQRGTTVRRAGLSRERRCLVGGSVLVGGSLSTGACPRPAAGPQLGRANNSPIP